MLIFFSLTSLQWSLKRPLCKSLSGFRKKASSAPQFLSILGKETALALIACGEFGDPPMDFMHGKNNESGCSGAIFI